MGVLAPSSSSCHPADLFLPSQDSQLSWDWAPAGTKLGSGQHLLTCWLQILPLAPVLPKTTLGFSKMHSSVPYWMDYWSFSYYDSRASVILVIH